jgi:stearoyl-CoA desaturase (delta-9 desaturase)
MNNIFSVSSRSLIVFHSLAYFAFFYQILFGNLFEWIVTLIVYLVLFTLGGTVGFHRLLSHRSFKCHPLIEKIFTFLGTIGGNGSSITWVAIHREHHRYSDTELDPHRASKGFFRIQFLSTLETPSFRYVPDLLRSKFHLFLHKYYWLVNLMYALAVSLYETNAILYAYLVPAILVWNLGSLINTVNHKHGYRRYKTKDNSVNNVLLGYLASGEGWHNNHHAAPSDPKFGKKWWEFDLGYFIIRAIKQ